MRDLISRIPADVFWAFMAGALTGIAVSWRFARLLERMREALHRAKHHYTSALDYWGYAMKHLAATAIVGGLTLAAVGALGFAVYLRATGRA